MYLTGTLTFGIILFGLGVGIYLLLRLSIRIGFQPNVSILTPLFSETKLAASKERAILIVQSGGQLIYADSTAQEWFGIPNLASDLESLIKQTTPAEAFLNLCNSGEKSILHVRTHQVEGNSYPFPIGPLSACLIALNEIDLNDTYRDNGKEPGCFVQPDNDALSRFTESMFWLNRTAQANTDIRSIVQTLIGGVRTFVACDLLEITILDQVAQQITRYTSTEGHLGEYVGELLEHTCETPTGFTRYLLNQRTPLFITDIHSEKGIALPVAWESNPYRSYLGIPLLYNDEPIGTLELASLREHNFREQDIEFLNLLSSQATLILRIAQLNQKEEHDTDITVIQANSIKSPSDFSNEKYLFRQLIENVRSLIDVDIVGLLFYDREVRQLKAESPFYGISSEIIAQFRIPAPEGSPAESTFLRQKTIKTENASDDPLFLQLGLDNIVRSAGIKCSLLIPLTSTDLPLGYILLANKRDGTPFSDEDLALIKSLSQQTALTLENIRLVQSSQHRADQLTTLTQIASTLSSSLERTEFAASLLDHLKSLIEFDSGALWLIEEDELVLVAANGFVNVEDRIGVRVAIKDSLLFKEMVHEGTPINIGDVSGDSRFSDWDVYTNRSWVAVPLIAHGTVFGAISLEKIEAFYYSTNDVQIIQTFASHAAIALSNANLYEESLIRAQELDQRTKRLSLLYRLSTELSASLDREYIIETACREIFRAIHCEGVMAIGSESKLLYCCGTDPTENSSNVLSVILEIPEDNTYHSYPIPELPLFDRLSQSFGLFLTDDQHLESELEPLSPILTERNASAVLILPFYTGNLLYGFVLIYTSESYHFTLDEIELARTICNQAAISLETARLFAETRSLKDDLEKHVSERTAQLASEHQRNETLLRIITELSASLDLDQVLHRTLVTIQETIGASHIACFLWRQEVNSLEVLASAGYPAPIPVGALPPELELENQLALEIIQKQTPILIPNLKIEPYKSKRSIQPSKKRCSIGVPLLLGKEMLGALLLFHPEPERYSGDQFDLIQAAGNQIAIAINNAGLFQLIQDQARDLGNLLRKQQIETSRSRAILEAISEGVLVTDSRSRINLFNDSAQRILNLSRDQIIDQPLEHFSGLFGGASRSWIETIHNWSSSPTMNSNEESYSEQITLDNGRVVSVNLAPVIYRDEFLGTVSIFHDITHQIEVDRLKSEFVATVSHELRTPMTSIKGYVEILLMGAAGSLSSQQTRFLEIVRNNSERLAILVNDLIDISRIESGRVELSFQPVDIQTVVAHIIEDLRLRSSQENKAMTISTDIPQNIPRVMADPERFRQILDNILSNAYAYTPENGRITIRARQVINHVQVDVQDTGIGIPPEDHNRVFERFYRGDHPFVLATSGTGLGLSITRQLVEMHQGRIWLESSGVPGEGCTFSFTIPIYHQDSILVEEEASVWQKY